MYNGYFYPQDIKIVGENGKQPKEWLEEYHPLVYCENIVAKRCHSEGMSVSQFRVYWEENKNKEFNEYMDSLND